MKDQILQATHWGIDIYGHVLRLFYADSFALTSAKDNAIIVRNPYNENKQTLQIKVHPTINGFIARHLDLEKPSFNGDAFDFASLYYKCSGSELWNILNNRLYLHIGNDTNTQETALFSFFRGPIHTMVPYAKVNLRNVYEVLTGGYYKQKTEYLRTIQDKAQARKYKASAFDFCTFSGLFNTRKAEGLVKHSGLLCLDFDHVEELNELKNRLLGDTMFETQLLFRSPSGDGLKWVIKIDKCNLSHSEYFSAVANYIKYTYNVEVDRSGRDVCRACFLPYDAEAYINPNV